MSVKEFFGNPASLTGELGSQEDAVSVEVSVNKVSSSEFCDYRIEVCYCWSGGRGYVYGGEYICLSPDSDPHSNCL